MKRIILYIAFLFPFLIASCTEKEDVGTEGNGKEQSYIPFAINKGVNISSWLSQSDVRGEARKNYFTEAEVKQLASFGFDHIRLPMDEEQLFTEDGQKIPEAFELMHNAIKWCKDANMRVITDLHILRSHHFNGGSDTQVIKSFVDDFENGSTSGWFSYNQGELTAEVVNNPEIDNINPSQKVLRINKTSNTEWMATAKDMLLPLGMEANQFKYLRMKVRKNIARVITIELQDENGVSVFTGYTPSTANKWETISIPMDKKNATFKRLVLRPDNGPGELYVDDIRFSTSNTSDITEIVITQDNTPKLWKEKEAQYKYFDLWKTLAEELKQYPNDLVAYELLNEPVAPYASQWNSLSAQLIQQIRRAEPERKLVIGSNKWQGVNTFDELTVPANDPNIILSFHFYNPHLFTHYKAEWTEMKDLNVAIHYPGELITKADYATLSDEYKKIVDHYMGSYDKAILAAMVQKAMDRAQKLGLQLHCGEFGCYNKTPRADKINWMQDIVSIFRDNNIAYSYWDYKAGFGFCNSKGEVSDQEILNLLTK